MSEFIENITATVKTVTDIFSLKDMKPGQIVQVQVNEEGEACEDKYTILFVNNGRPTVFDKYGVDNYASGDTPVAVAENLKAADTDAVKAEGTPFLIETTGGIQDIDSNAQMELKSLSGACDSNLKGVKVNKLLSTNANLWNYYDEDGEHVTDSPCLLKKGWKITREGTAASPSGWGFAKDDAYALIVIPTPNSSSTGNKGLRVFCVDSTHGNAKEEIDGESSCFIHTASTTDGKCYVIYSSYSAMKTAIENDNLAFYNEQTLHWATPTDIDDTSAELYSYLVNANNDITGVACLILCIKLEGTHIQNLCVRNTWSKNWNTYVKGEILGTIDLSLMYDGICPNGLLTTGSEYDTIEFNGNSYEATITQRCNRTELSGDWVRTVITNYSYGEVITTPTPTGTSHVFENTEEDIAAFKAATYGSGEGQWSVDFLQCTYQDEGESESTTHYRVKESSSTYRYTRNIASMKVNGSIDHNFYHSSTKQTLNVASDTNNIYFESTSSDFDTLAKFEAAIVNCYLVYERAISVVSTGTVNPYLDCDDFGDLVTIIDEDSTTYSSYDTEPSWSIYYFPNLKDKLRRLVELTSTEKAGITHYFSSDGTSYTDANNNSHETTKLVPGATYELGSGTTSVVFKSIPESPYEITMYFIAGSGATITLPSGTWLIGDASGFSVNDKVCISIKDGRVITAVFDAVS